MLVRALNDYVEKSVADEPETQCVRRVADSDTTHARPDGLSSARERPRYSAPCSTQPKPGYLRERRTPLTVDGSDEAQSKRSKSGGPHASMAQRSRMCPTKP